MKISSSKRRQTIKSGQFILTCALGEKFNAVEGRTLSPRMATILRKSAEQGLSGDERRALVMETLRRK